MQSHVQQRPSVSFDDGHQPVDLVNHVDHDGVADDSGREPPVAEPAGLDRIGWGAVVGGALCTAGGLAVVVAWHLGALWLLRPNGDATPIVYNTGVAFALIGVALVAHVLDRRRMALLGSALAALLAVVTLLQYVLHRGLAVDQLLFRTSITGQSGAPGRMAPNTAVCLLTVSAALWWRTLGPARGRAAVTGSTAGLVLATASIAGAGYASDHPSAYKWGSFTPMALPTAGLFGVVGAVLLALAGREPHGFHGAGENGALSSARARAGAQSWSVRRVVVALALFTYVPLGVMAYLVETMSAGAVSREAEARVETAARLEASAVLARMEGLRAMAALVAARPDIIAALGGGTGTPDVAALQTLLDGTVTVERGVVSLSITDPGGMLLAVSPATPEVVGRDFSVRDWYQGAARTGDAYVSEAVQSVTGDRPLVVGIAAPIRSGPGRPVIGFFSMDYLLTAIQEFVADFDAGQLVALSVTDQRGVVLASPNQPEGLVSVAAHEPVRSALAGASGVVTEDGPDGRQLVGFASVGDLGWTITASVSESVAHSRVAVLRAAVVAIALTLAAGLTVALVLMARTWRGRARYMSDLEKATTERNDAEVALHRSDERFRSLIQNSTDVILVVDTAGTLLYGSPASQQVLGYQPDAMLGTSALDLVHPDDRSFVASALVRSASITGIAPAVTYRVRHASGEWRWIESVAKNLLDDPSIGGIVINARDVTPQMESALAMKNLNRILRTVTDADAAVVHATSEAELIEQMCRVIVETGGYALAWIAAPDSWRPGRVVPVTTYGGVSEFHKRVTAASHGGPVKGGPTTAAMAARETRVVQDIETLPPGLPLREISLEFGYRSQLALPLLVADEVIGVLSIHANDAGAFDHGEIELFEQLAGDLAYGVASLRTGAERQEYSARLERSVDALAGAISAVVEARDPLTAGHQRRVAELSVAIARDLGLDDDVIAGIRVGADIHDIGMTAIPAQILSMPRKLSAAEFELIKDHPQAGHDIVEGIDFSWPVGRMILEHHERMDGSGYPNGLHGSELLIESRIIAVADTVEAMVSHRPYRARFRTEVALAQIERDRGTLFDADAVDACLRVFRENRFTFTRTPDNPPPNERRRRQPPSSTPDGPTPER